MEQQPNNTFYYTEYQNVLKEAEKWPFMGNAWSIFILVACYLIFVLKIGPQWMKNRPPYNLKIVMLFYNLYQTLFNGWFVFTMITLEGAFMTALTKGCHPPKPWETPFYRVASEMAWYFFISKVADLLDTVFLILKKKNDHVSFLHVYHHANMALFTWAFLKYIKGEQGIIVGWLNACVHTVMYSYYFLAALGPQVRKYLWWKKYITWFQMVQFVLIICYMGYLLLARCSIAPQFAYMLIFQGVSFFLLFTNFYVKAYIVKSSKQHAPVKTSLINYSNFPQLKSQSQQVNAHSIKEKEDVGEFTETIDNEKCMEKNEDVKIDNEILEDDLIASLPGKAAAKRRNKTQRVD